MNEYAAPLSLSHRADELEEQMMHELGERIATRSTLFNIADGKVEMANGPALKAANPDKYFLMGADPRLPKMPDKPTLIDFFKHRITPAAHMLQSASLAKRRGASEEIILACLLHDTGQSLMKTDHGWWSAQIIEPYVAERVVFAVKYHQALRFYPDPAAGYEYPESYFQIFGVDYVPPPHIKAAYEYARNHKWYMDARLVTLNDLYAFDPNVHVSIDEFADVIARHFRQPKEGLGYDNSPVAHMWRTMINPDAPL